MDSFYGMIQKNSEDLRRISMFIHDNPELGFCEFKAAEKLTAFLKAHGFPVQSSPGGLATAFRTEYGSGGKTFFFLAEYDALKGLGHACGHNLICVASLAAFLAAAEHMKENHIPGKIALIGTPAEEVYGGKLKLAEQGVFEDGSAAIMAHPESVTATDPGWISAVKLKIRFFGRAAHASAKPEAALNALDAAVAMYQSIALWRQQLPEGTRVHCIFTEGGTSPNIIPERAELFCYIRAGNAAETDRMEARMRAMAEGSALSTGTRAEVEVVSREPATLFNTPLNRLYAELWERRFGEKIRSGSGCEGRASTDFGAVSRKMPGACFLFDAAQGAEHQLHTEEFRRDAATDFAFEQAMKTASVMAEMAVQYLTDQAFREAAEADFRTRMEMEK